MGWKGIALHPPACAWRVGPHGRDAHRAGSMGVEAGVGVLERGLHVPAVAGVRIVGSSLLRRGGTEIVGLVVVLKLRLRRGARGGAGEVPVGRCLHALREQQHHHAHLHPPRQRARRGRLLASVADGFGFKCSDHIFTPRAFLNRDARAK